jgi:large conductance mechanosensitive channel
MLKEFKDFLSRRNVIDLAIGVIIGSALTTVVKSLVNNLINPLIGLVINRQLLVDLHFTIGHASFDYGSFINDLIAFLLTAFIVFVIIKGVNKTFALEKAEEKDEQLETLKEIRDLLKEKKED